MTKGRLEAFSDGVIAIIITITILEIGLPEGDDLHGGGNGALDHSRPENEESLRRSKVRGLTYSFRKNEPEGTPLPAHTRLVTISPHPRTKAKYLSISSFSLNLAI